MALMAQHDPPEERHRQWHASRERELAHLVEAEKQTSHCEPRDAQLVRPLIPLHPFISRITRAPHMFALLTHEGTLCRDNTPRAV